jgi:hypothetical protein
MFCPRCGKEQLDSSAFCGGCGQSLKPVDNQGYTAAGVRTLEAFRTKLGDQRLYAKVVLVSMSASFALAVVWSLALAAWFLLGHREEPWYGFLSTYLLWYIPWAWFWGLVAFWPRFVNTVKSGGLFFLPAWVILYFANAFFFGCVGVGILTFFRFFKRYRAPKNT